MTQDYEKIKWEIADGYLKKFKDELWWFKSLKILPMEGKIKKMMISDAEVDEDNLKDVEDLGRWRNVLWFITPKISSDILDFLKEKQKLIIEAETENKLEELKNEVVFGKITKETEEKTETKEDTTTKDTTTAVTPMEKESAEKTEEKTDDKTGSRNSVENGVLVWVTGATAYKTMEKTVTKYNDMKLKDKMDFKVSTESAKTEIGKMKTQMDNMVEETKNATKNPKLSRSVRKNLEKSSKKFAEVAESLGDEEVISARDARGKLGKDIPQEMLNTIDPNTAKAFSELDDAVFEQIAKTKNVDEITEILTKNGIKDMKPEMVNVLKNMDDAANIKAFSKVLRYGKKLSPLMKGLSCVSAVDLLFFWFDVRMRNESMNEADFIAKVNEARASVKRSRANFELFMGAVSIALELWIILTCSAVGWTAWSVVPGIGNAVGFVVGLVVGVVTFVIQDMVGQLYYDKLDFYTQNREDYIKQDRTNIKQAILQCAKEQEVDANPSLTDEALNEKGINTFQDAWEALIFQEELDKYDKGLLPADDKFPLIKARNTSWSIKSDYVAELSAEDKVKWDAEREKMDKRIANRMAYVKKFITKENSTEKYERFMENIQANTWLSYIEKIVGESDVYVEMNDPKNEYITGGFSWNVNEYRTKLEDDLKAEYPDEFATFDALYTSDKSKVDYICTGAKEYVISDESIFTETELTAIKKNQEFLKKFYHYKNLWLTIENTSNVTVSYMDYDYNYLERVLMDFDQLEVMSNFNDKNVKDYFTKSTWLESRLKTDYQVSSSTWQNILYRMAREFHGYSWNNDMFELMSFYDEASDDTKGIYYDNERMVNNDENTFGWDRRYNQNQGMFFLGGVIPNAIINRFSTIDRDWELDDIDKKNMTADEVYSKFDGVLMLDSKVDVADKEAVEEFKAEIKKIIEEEIAAKAPEKKKEVEQEIADFVKTQSKALGDTSEVAEDGSLTYTGTTTSWYVEIPYNLVIKAKKAKIGDIEKFLFKYEDGKIVAVSSKQYVDVTLDFDTAEVSYEKVTPLRETLTDEENKVIAKVEGVKKRLDALRGVESAREDEIFGGHEDEIDIPVEIEREMTKKAYERENLKESLLYLNVTESKSKLLENRSTYYNYFNSTYMGMLGTISQFTRNDNLWSFTRMSQARAWIGKERYKLDDAGNITFDHLDLEDDEKEYILEYIQKSYQWETKTVAELLKSTSEDEKAKGERMLDQIMVSVFESETLFMDEKIGNIRQINQQKDSYDADVEKRVQANLGDATYVNVIDTLTAIDETKVKTQTPEIKEVSKVEKEIYTEVNEVLATIIETMNNVDRWYGRGELKFVADDKETTDTKIVGKIVSRWAETKVTVDTVNKTYSIDGLGYTFKDGTVQFLNKTYAVSNMKEWAYTASLINWIKGKYLKEHPDKKWEFFFGSWSWGLFVENGLNDTDILDDDTIEEKFHRMNSESGQTTFLNFANSL